MRGKVLRKDDRVRWFISSANRDPDDVPEPGHVRHHPPAEPACGLRLGHSSLPRRDAGAGRGPGGVQGAGRALPRLPARQRGAGISAQHHLPVAEIAAGHLGNRRRTMARKLRVRVDHHVCVGNAMCETFAPNVFRLNDDRQSEAVDPAGDRRRRSSKPRRTARSARSSSRMPRPANSCFPSCSIRPMARHRRSTVASSIALVQPSGRMLVRH